MDESGTLAVRCAMCTSIENKIIEWLLSMSGVSNYEVNENP